MSSNLAKNISALRNRKGLSQDELAIDLDIGRSRLGAYEEGRNEPPIKLLVAIADYFEVSVDALLKDDLKI